MLGALTGPLVGGLTPCPAAVLSLEPPGAASAMEWRCQVQEYGVMPLRLMGKTLFKVGVDCQGHQGCVWGRVCVRPVLFLKGWLLGEQ